MMNTLFETLSEIFMPEVIHNGVAIQKHGKGYYVPKLTKYFHDLESAIKEIDEKLK